MATWAVRAAVRPLAVLEPVMALPEPITATWRLLSIDAFSGGTRPGLGPATINSSQPPNRHPLSLYALISPMPLLAALSPAGSSLVAAPSFQAAALAILPLALGSAVSPLVLVAQILTVTRSGSGLRAGWWFVLGSAVLVSLWIGLALVVGHALPQPAPGPDPESACLRLVLALVLLGLGLKLLQAAPASVESNGVSQSPARDGLATGTQDRQATRRHPLRRAFGLGLVTMASNLTSLVLVFPAVHDLGRDRLPGLEELLLVGLIAFFTLLPSLAPPLLLLVSGAGGQRQLERLNGWTQAHQRQISGGLCLAFGLLLTVSGLSSL